MTDRRRSWLATYRPPGGPDKRLGTFTALVGKAGEVMRAQWKTYGASGFVVIEPDPEDGSFEQRQAAR